MTEDKARKIATRQRMAETGEPYSVARRAVEDEHDAAEDLRDDSMAEDARPRRRDAAPATPGTQAAARPGTQAVAKPRPAPRSMLSRPANWPSTRVTWPSKRASGPNGPRRTPTGPRKPPT